MRVVLGFQAVRLLRSGLQQAERRRSDGSLHRGHAKELHRLESGAAGHAEHC